MFKIYTSAMLLFASTVVNAGGTYDNTYYGNSNNSGYSNNNNNAGNAKKAGIFESVKEITSTIKELAQTKKDLEQMNSPQAVNQQGFNNQPVQQYQPQQPQQYQQQPVQQFDPYQPAQQYQAAPQWGRHYLNDLYALICIDIYRADS